MKRKLLTVEDRFYIEGRNALAAYQFDMPSFNLKDEIVIVRPDGAEMAATIAAAELTESSGGKMVSILLENLNKTDVPIGTEIFLKI